MLGPVEILGPVEPGKDGQAHGLGSRKERGVLAVLLWELGHAIAAETVATRVWDSDLPGTRDQVYTNVSRLRRLLRKLSGDERDWVPGLDGYRLDARREDVDLFRFRDLRDEARVALDAGENEHAFELLDEADRLWHGPPLAGLDGKWTESIRVSLNEERYHATVMRMEAGLRSGRHAGLIGELFKLAAEHPLKDEPTRLLMHALYRSGRRADALQLYQPFHRNYIAEMGTRQSSAKLRQLHQLMLDDAPELLLNPSARRAAPLTPTNTLPRDDPDFTGRTKELATLAGWIRSGQAQSTVPVIVISGIHGIGKTTLAVHAARVFGDRYSEKLFVELRGNSPEGNPVEPAQALGSLLHGLGVSDHVIPDGVDERAAMWRSRLDGKRVLIVLDDAASSAQIRPLLPSAAGCLMLITARQKTIDVSGGRWLSLDPMPPAEAAALFERATGAGRVSDEAGVDSVLRLCCYVPQEIAMAARELRRHPAWDVRDLATRLLESNAEGGSVPPALALSLSHLTLAQQRLLRQLALHPEPGFSRHAAAAMAGDQSLLDTQRALDVLLDYHLIKEPVTDRFAFRDPIRAHARRLAQTHDTEADRDSAMRRLLDYYLWLADQADRAVYPFHRRIPIMAVSVPPVPPVLRTRLDYRRWIEAERHVLLAVARHAAVSGHAEHAGLLAHALASFLDTWGYYADAVELHRLAVGAWRSVGNVTGEAKALTELSFMLARIGRYPEALRHAQDALALARAAVDRAAEADALDRIGIVLWKEARYPEALARYDQALAIWQALGNRDGEADALAHGGIAAWHLNRYPEALGRTERALALYRELGNAQGEALALNNLGDLQQDAGDHDLALTSYWRALEMFRESGSRQGEAIAVNNVGDIYRQLRRDDDAVTCYRAALDIYRDIGDLRCQADTLNNLGAAYLQRGHYDDALEQHQAALIIAHQLAERFLKAKSLIGSGDVRLAVGDYSSAAGDYRAAAELSRQIGDRSQEANALRGLGDAVQSTDGKEAARGCWLNALSILESIGKSAAADAVRARLGENMV